MNVIDTSDTLQTHPVLEPDDSIFSIIEVSFEIPIHEISNDLSAFRCYVSLVLVDGYGRFGPNYEVHNALYETVGPVVYEDCVVSRILEWDG